MSGGVAVGIVGLGRMGRAAAKRLLDAGHPVLVFNRTPDRCAELAADGAIPVDKPAQLAAQAGVVLTMLADDRAVESVYLDTGGLLEGVGPAAPTFVEMSTIRTATVARLRERVEQCGARLVDAPMSGPPAAVRAGSLLVLAGGEPNDVMRVEPVLRTFSRRVVRVGPAGSGTTMKLVLQLPMAVLFAALAEALSMGARLGLDVDTMLDVILDSQGAPPVLRARADLIRAGGGSLADGADGFDVAGVRKDLQAMVATALDAGVPASTTAAALGVFSSAAASGDARRDLAAVVDHALRAAQSLSPGPLAAPNAE